MTAPSGRWVPHNWHPPLIVDHARKTVVVATEEDAELVRQRVPTHIELNELEVITSQFCPEGKVMVINNEKLDEDALGWTFDITRAVL